MEKEMQIIRNPKVETEVKLFLIMDLLHDKRITLKKSFELCTECGLFEDHWITVDNKVVKEFTKNS